MYDLWEILVRLCAGIVALSSLIVLVYLFASRLAVRSQKEILEMAKEQARPEDKILPGKWFVYGPVAKEADKRAAQEEEAQRLYIRKYGMPPELVFFDENIMALYLGPLPGTANTYKEKSGHNASIEGE